MVGALDLVSRLKAIRDPGMRAARMVELFAGNPEAVVIALHTLLGSSGGPRDPNIEVLDAMIGALGSERVAYEVRAQIYAAAIDRADAVVARLFLDGRRQKSDTGNLEDALGEARALTPRGRALTLGERKSIARGRRDQRLLHLLADPHPDVIGILLGNPHLIEADVLVIASRRPTLAASLAKVLASNKWRARYRVKRALVFNPYSPSSIGIRLCCCLNDTDLRAVVADPKLGSLVRQQAAGLLELRRG